jgi:hypothetical protein
VIKNLLKWLWKGNADEIIEQKEYESMAGMVEEFGEEQEQEERKGASGALTRQGLPADANEGSKPKSYFSDIAGDE